jgi:hypothetical protein
MSSKSKSTAQPAHPFTEDHDQEERPHACNDGWITLGRIVLDPETGEDTEEMRFTSAASAQSEARA